MVGNNIDKRSTAEDYLRLASREWRRRCRYRDTMATSIRDDAIIEIFRSSDPTTDILHPDTDLEVELRNRSPVRRRFWWVIIRRRGRLLALLIFHARTASVCSAAANAA